MKRQKMNTERDWVDDVPTKADAGDAYYFVRRKDRLDVVIMGFSMGKGWLNGVSYDASELRNHLFLGPITPELFAEMDQLRKAGEAALLAFDTATFSEFDNTGNRAKRLLRAALQPADLKHE
jgi:hypothetical protein